MLSTAIDSAQELTAAPPAVAPMPTSATADEARYAQYAVAVRDLVCRLNEDVDAIKRAFAQSLLLPYAERDYLEQAAISHAEAFAYLQAAFDRLVDRPSGCADHEMAANQWQTALQSVGVRSLRNLPNRDFRDHVFFLTVSIDVRRSCQAAERSIRTPSNLRDHGDASR